MSSVALPKSLTERNQFLRQNIPCGRYKSCFPELVTSLHFTVLVAPQDLSQQKSVSKVPLTLWEVSKCLTALDPKIAAGKAALQLSTAVRLSQSNEGPDMVLWEETRAARP